MDEDGELYEEMKMLSIHWLNFENNNDDIYEDRSC